MTRHTINNSTKILYQEREYFVQIWLRATSENLITDFKQMLNEIKGIRNIMKELVALRSQNLSTEYLFLSSTLNWLTAPSKPSWTLQRKCGIVGAYYWMLYWRKLENHKFNDHKMQNQDTRELTMNGDSSQVLAKLCRRYTRLLTPAQAIFGYMIWCSHW